MKEAKTLALAAREASPELPRHLEQIERALHVGANKLSGIVDGAIDMTLSGEMNDGARLVSRKQLRNNIGIADISAHEDVARVAGKALKVTNISRVSQFVEIDNLILLGAQPFEYKIRSNESGAARYEYCLGKLQSNRPFEVAASSRIVCSLKPFRYFFALGFGLKASSCP